jgi:hypothetical protein
MQTKTWILNCMSIGNHEYNIQNRLKINLFTPTPRGVN